MQLKRLKHENPDYKRAMGEFKEALEALWKAEATFYAIQLMKGTNAGLPRIIIMTEQITTWTFGDKT